LVLNGGILSEELLYSYFKREDTLKLRRMYGITLPINKMISR
jgi:hypothetical protein